MTTSKYAILGVIVCTILTALAQSLMKLASQELSFKLEFLFNPFLISAVFTYLVAVVVLILSLKHGELSILYPIIALSFVWVTIISAVYLKESINIFKTTAIIAIIAGVSFLGVGSRR